MPTHHGNVNPGSNPVSLIPVQACIYPCFHPTWLHKRIDTEHFVGGKSFYKCVWQAFVCTAVHSNIALFTASRCSKQDSYLQTGNCIVYMMVHFHSGVEKGGQDVRYLLWKHAHKFPYADELYLWKIYFSTFTLPLINLSRILSKLAQISIINDFRWACYILHRGNIYLTIPLLILRLSLICIINWSSKEQYFIYNWHISKIISQG